jgi:hypothetical protein
MEFVGIVFGEMYFVQLKSRSLLIGLFREVCPHHRESQEAVCASTRRAPYDAHPISVRHTQVIYASRAKLTAPNCSNRENEMGRFPVNSLDPLEDFGRQTFEFLNPYLSHNSNYVYVPEKTTIMSPSYASGGATP